jgi:hypothetical protein
MNVTPDDVQNFVNAVKRLKLSKLQDEALQDIRKLGLASLGIGAAGASAVGMYNMMRSKQRKRRRWGPALLPLPYPVEESPQGQVKEGQVEKVQVEVSPPRSKGGFPWYYPAMFAAALGGFGLGYGGLTNLLREQRRRENEEELSKARREFRQAILAQYDEPLESLPGVSPKKAADRGQEKDEPDMVKVGKALDALWGRMQQLLGTSLEKEALDIGGLMDRIPGFLERLPGIYGAYAGLSALLTGAIVYDRIEKRSRRKLLENALRRQQRRLFEQQPDAIYAIPEPVMVPPVPAGTEGGHGRAPSGRTR